MWLLMYPLMAAYTEDKVIILVAGTMAGVFAFFVTWAFQLAVRNKNLPVNRTLNRMEKKSSFEEDIFEDKIGSYGEDSLSTGLEG